MFDSVDAIIHFAQTMMWKGKHPTVELVTTTYQNGVKLAREAMQAVETHLQRWLSLEKWFVDISSRPAEKRPRGHPRTSLLADGITPTATHG